MDYDYRNIFNVIMYLVYAVTYAHGWDETKKNSFTNSYNVIFKLYYFT